VGDGDGIAAVDEGDRRRVVLVTFADFPADHPEVGGALRAAGLELRLAPKLGPRSEPELAALLPDVVGAIVSTDPFTAAVLRGAPALRVVARTGVGFDTVDLDAASALGIQVVTTPGLNEHAVADHTIGLMLAWLRMIPLLDADVRRGGWHRNGQYLPRQLAGSTVGIIGYGGIGRQVAARLSGFGCTLLVHDPALSPGDPIRSMPLDDLLARSDIVTLHCPLLPETRGLINARTLAVMPAGSLLVNASRGPVVDEAALVTALSSGHLGGAALDVLEHEPPDPASPLLTFPNVIVSPHNAGLSTISAFDMSRACARAVLTVLDGGVAEAPDSRVVNRTALAQHPDPAVRRRYEGDTPR
jgi:phosphoglycerate dehydrogenase-like enzyme